MPLADYQPATREVKLAGGNSFSVRGLSLNDVSVLVREHFPDLDALAGLFDGFDNLTVDQFEPLAMSLVSQAPGFVANTIAIAAGEGTAADAEKLPGPVQVKALLEIGDLTFVDVGGPKKALEMIAGLLTKNQVKKALTKVKATKTA